MIIPSIRAACTTKLTFLQFSVLSTIEPVNATALKLKWSGNTYNVSTSVHYQSIFTETGAVMNHFDTTVEANITSLEITVQDCVPGYHHNFFLQFIVPVIGSLATTASFIFGERQ